MCTKNLSDILLQFVMGGLALYLSQNACTIECCQQDTIYDPRIPARYIAYMKNSFFTSLVNSSIEGNGYV